MRYRSPARIRGNREPTPTVIRVIGGGSIVHHWSATGGPSCAQQSLRGFSPASWSLPGQRPAFAAGNPSGTGLPSQSCQDVEAAGGTVPGNSSSSPGSPFNEAGINSTDGGIGGQHYNETSQYDVACFQVSQH